MKKEIRSTYQYAYYKKEHSYMNVVESNYINNLVEKIISVAGLSKKDKILEIGCGKGRFSIPLLKRGYKLTCVDFSTELLEEFKKNISSGMKVKLINDDFTKIYKNFKNEFDHIIGFYVLHHLNDLKSAFKKMRFMLKDGGKITFSENNPYNIMYYIQIMLVKDITWRGEKGILNMRKKIIYPLLESLRFKNIRIERYGFFPPLIVNTKIGQKFEKKLEKIKIFYPFLPFQIISAEKPK